MRKHPQRTVLPVRLPDEHRGYEVDEGMDDRRGHNAAIYGNGGPIGAQDPGGRAGYGGVDR